MRKRKGVWLFLVVGILLITSVCYYFVSQEKRTVYANGRIVEEQQDVQGDRIFC